MTGLVNGSVVTHLSLGGQVRAIADLPTGVLVALLFKWHGPEVLGIARELRSRESQGREGRWFGRTLSRMNQIDPPPCACGKPGLYIVGSTTYCRKCRAMALLHRSETGCSLHNKSQDQKSEEIQEVEAARKSREQRKKFEAHRRGLKA